MSCTLTGCGRPHYARGYCRAHHARWRRHGDPRAGVPIGAAGASHRSARRRIRTQRGPATDQSCACGAPAVGWFYDGTDPDERTDSRGHRYSLDPSRYRPLCRSCRPRAASRRKARAGMAAVDVERAARLYRGGATARGIGALLQHSPTTVLAALRAHGVPIRAPARAPRR